MSEIRKTYASGDVTIVWQPSLCIHSEKCFHGLPAVFDPTRRPWIDPHAATAETIIAQVRNCPSGALSIESGNKAAGPKESAVRAEVLRDGPLLVHGDMTVVDAEGKTTAHEGATAFCRCGASKNKPYCDGSHKTVGFSG